MVSKVLLGLLGPQERSKMNTLEENFTNTILDWMRDFDYGSKDGHSPAMLLSQELIKNVLQDKDVNG